MFLLILFLLFFTDPNDVFLSVTTAGLDGPVTPHTDEPTTVSVPTDVDINSIDFATLESEFENDIDDELGEIIYNTNLL